MSTILVVDDEIEVVNSVTEVLNGFGYNTIGITDSRTGYKQATEQKFDLIILDWMMPMYDGVQFTRDFRQAGYTTPILFLTAKGRIPAFQIEALRQGADNYMDKPFDTTLLVETVNTIIRRSQINDENKSGNNGKHSYDNGALVIDTDAMQVYRDGVSCELTANEYNLILYLEQNKGKVCTRDRLLEDVWGYQFIGDARTVDVTVKRTRAKIEPDQENYRYILTRRGSGYYFNYDLK